MNCALLLVLTVAAILHQTQAQGTGSVRLYNNGNVSPTNTQGVVQVYYGGRWGPICNTGTTDNGVASTVCHQLGYTGGNLETSLPNDPTEPVLGEVSCASATNYLVILQCYYNSAPSSSCTNVQVTCYSTRIWAVPYTGMVRLQGGYYTGQGRVEVYCNGQWGSVCSTGFDSNTATTVCTQLGYNDHTSSGSTSVVGNTWLSNVNCPFTQSCLHFCASCSSTNLPCSTAANVTCSYDTSSNQLGSTRYSCGVDLSGLGGAAIAGIIIASLVGLLCFFLIIIGIPICICCCLGVGIGAATSRPKYSTI